MSAMKKASMPTGKRKIIIIAATALMCALATVGLTVFACSFLPITKVELSGVTDFDKAEIVKLSGIKMGDKLYSVKTNDVEKHLMEVCPKFEKVEVKTKFPNTIVFKVTEKIPMWYIDIADSYYVLDSKLEVIDEVQTKEHFADMGVPQLVLPAVKSVILGELPVFGDPENEEKTDVSSALEFISAVQKTTFKARITTVDVSNRFDVKIVVDGKYYVQMGDCSNTEAKLKAVNVILTSDKLKNCDAAEIYAANPAEIISRPLPLYDE